MDKRRIEGQGAIKKIRNLGKMAGGIIPMTVFYGFPGRSADEDGVMPEMVFHAGPGVGTGSHRHHVYDLYIVVGILVGHQGIH